MNSDLSPAFVDHEFLELMHMDDEAHKFTYALVAGFEGKWFHIGTACRITDNLLITAKHILEHLSRHIVGIKIDIYDPDAQQSPHGHKFTPPPGVEIHALQFIEGRGDVRRYSVLGAVWVGYKNSDLLLLEIKPHSQCPHKDEPAPKSPRLDLGVPKPGREIAIYGYPDNPKYPAEACNSFLSANWLYRSKGTVTALNFDEGSAQFTSYETTAKTISGMSGGPVFTIRDGEWTFCGILSRGGSVDYSVVSPLWLIGQCVSDYWPGMPEKHGFTSLAELMKDGTIPTKGAEALNIDYEDFVVTFDGTAKNGY